MSFDICCLVSSNKLEKSCFWNGTGKTDWRDFRNPFTNSNVGHLFSQMTIDTTFFTYRFGTIRGRMSDFFSTFLTKYTQQQDWTFIFQMTVDATFFTYCFGAVGRRMSDFFSSFLTQVTKIFVFVVYWRHFLRTVSDCSLYQPPGLPPQRKHDLFWWLFFLSEIYLMVRF